MKFLYYYSKLNIGGAEKSTVRLLNLLREKGHDITLLQRWSGGQLERELNPGVHILHLKVEHRTRSRAARLFFFALETLLSLFRRMRLGRTEYDICINGLFGYDPAILFRNIRAKQHYQMLRNDVRETGDFGKTGKYMERYGSRFDAYIGVSKYTTESFRSVYPEFSGRAHTIYNVLPNIPDAFGDNPYRGYEDRLKIVSVCRLADRAKGLFRMAEVCAELKRLYGNRFVWFIVGGGPDGERLREKIRKLELEDHMILCGTKPDPYPYYHDADLVAVLSYYEGLCGVVNEAKLMRRPVIATEFSGIHEQLTDGVNGKIVANRADAILAAMREFMEHPERLAAFRNNGLPEELRDNDFKIRRFEELYLEIEKEKTHA